MEQFLPDMSKRDVCGIVDRMFRKRSADPEMTTKFLFSLASQASGCRNFAAAERILEAARKRTDFAAAVPAKDTLLLSAQIAFGKEQWQKAAELYAKYDKDHGADSDALMNIARAHRNLGDHAQAQRWYEAHIRKFPSHAKTQEILWLRAWNAEEAKDYKGAAEAYRQVFNTAGKRTEEAHIRHALCYYRRKDFDSTIAHLAAFQKKFPQSGYLWAAMFWQGKSHAAAGRAEEARKIWTGLARLDPTDYYAHRARQIMKADTGNAFAAPRFAAQMTDAQMRAWLDFVSPSSRKKLTAKDSTDLRRGAALLSIARADIADFFLDEYEKNYSGNLQLQYEMAYAYALAGDPARSFRVARRLAWRIPMEQRENTPLQVLSIIYPPFYSETITPNAERFNVDPLFVSAVMRQESIFDYKIVSPAGAVGLMQIMPATGRGIAKEPKENFTEDSLYRYSYNIRFGTFYLRKRLTQFGGDHVLALCSYNAGPNNAIKWRDRNRRSEYDLFVEDIGFFETRGYVKKVMGNYWTYRMLVDTPGYDYDLPLIRDEFPWVNDW
jgi:soluble lytic murein transglycosylase